MTLSASYLQGLGTGLALATVLYGVLGMYLMRACFQEQIRVYRETSNTLREMAARYYLNSDDLVDERDSALDPLWQPKSGEDSEDEERRYHKPQALENTQT